MPFHTFQTRKVKKLEKAIVVEAVGQLQLVA